MKKGFTLLEILLVIAAIGILASIVIVAINPNRQLAQVRDTSRERDIRSIRDALQQYSIDNGMYPLGLSSTNLEVCDSGANGVGEGSVDTDCIDLRSLVPTYLASIPRDSNAAPSQETGYFVSINELNNSISISSQLSELKEVEINSSISNWGLQFSIDLANSISYPGSGGTVYDLSGNGGNVTLSNGASIDTEFGGAIEFDGSNDYATFATPFSSEVNELTYEIWFKGVAGPGASLGYGYIVHNNNQNNTTGDSYVTMGVHGGAPYPYYSAFDGQFNDMRTGINETDSSVYHMTLTWDGGIQRVYVNGVLENQDTLNSISNSLDATTSIGSAYTSPSFRPFDGRVYQLRIYDRALAEEEVIQNFELHRERFGV